MSHPPFTSRSVYDPSTMLQYTPNYVKVRHKTFPLSPQAAMMTNAAAAAAAVSGVPTPGHEWLSDTFTSTSLAAQQAASYHHHHHAAAAAAFMSAYELPAPPPPKAPGPFYAWMRFHGECRGVGCCCAPRPTRPTGGLRRLQSRPQHAPTSGDVANFSSLSAFGGDAQLVMWSLSPGTNLFQ